MSIITNVYFPLSMNTNSHNVARRCESLCSVIMQEVLVHVSDVLDI